MVAMGTSKFITDRDKEPNTESEPESNSEPEPIKEQENIGRVRITAYCSCRTCCGVWADNRPGGIVITASGAEAVEGVTIAAGKSIPFDTVIYIDGFGEYIVQDRGGAIKDDCIDIYFSDHDAALEFGVQYAEAWIIK